MKTKKVLTFFFLFNFLLIFSISGWAYWVWSPESGKFVNPEGAVQDTAEEQYDYAMQLYKEKDLDEAADQFKHLLKKYPGSRIAPEAQYRLGVIQEEKGDYLKAFGAYKTLVESYPQSERVNEVIEREFRIGNLFLSGKKAKLMGMEILPSLSKAVEIFQHIVKQAPYGEWGDKAQFRLGLAHKKGGQYSEAIEAFQAFIDQYPKSELLPEARFQMAEISYLRSAAQVRDQRALEDASKYVDSFLTRYPDTDASEQAAKLRQQIDEKNAEKNYRIGLYYEKENYLSSALIYYSDVAERYPDTAYGKKAAEKLKSLKEPTTFITDQEKEVRESIQVLEAKLKGISDQDAAEKGKLKREIERLTKREKSLEKNKGESLNRREKDIKRREGELKGKYKNLKNKKKLLKTNTSDDFKRAIERWEASLDEEKNQLEEEKSQLHDWRKTLGIEPRKFSLDILPFVGEAPSELDEVRATGARKLYKLSEEKRILLDEKEVLYKQVGELNAILENFEIKRMGLDEIERALEKVDPKGGGDLLRQKEELASLRERIDALNRDLNAQKALYEKQFGAADWLTWIKTSQQVVTASSGTVAKSLQKSWQMVNPFDGRSSGLESKSLEELLSLRMHLKEKIVATQTMADTLSRAFDEELALQERKRLMAQLDRPGSETDVRELRKSVKQLEKSIRGGYEEIQDRHAQKRDLLKELKTVLDTEKDREQVLVKAGRTAARPAVGFFRFWKVFLFGLPDKDVETTREAAQITDGEASEQARKLKEEIELESLLIEIRHREIKNLEKELEILKAKASLAGGYQFRSSYVKIPYTLIGEAIDKARRMLPSQDRQEALINRMNDETKQLDHFRQELKQVETAIAARDSGQTPAVSPAEPEKSAGKVSEKSLPGEEELKANIEAMSQQLEEMRKQYQRDKALLETQLKAIGGESQSEMEKSSDQKSDLLQQEDKIRKELGNVTGRLEKLMSRELELESAEAAILTRRIQKIDPLLQKIKSKAVLQDLATEQERMKSRVSQIESRRDYLSRELKRFQTAEPAGASS